MTLNIAKFQESSLTKRLEKHTTRKKQFASLCRKCTIIFVQKDSLALFQRIRLSSFPEEWNRYEGVIYF